MDVEEDAPTELRDIINRYNLDDYDDEGVNDLALNHDLAVYADNRDDPFLNDDDEDSDVCIFFLILFLFIF